MMPTARKRNVRAQRSTRFSPKDALRAKAKKAVSLGPAPTRSGSNQGQLCCWVGLLLSVFWVCECMCVHVCCARAYVCAWTTGQVGKWVILFSRPRSSIVLRLLPVQSSGEAPQIPCRHVHLLPPRFGEGQSLLFVQEVSERLVGLASRLGRGGPLSARRLQRISVPYFTPFIHVLRVCIFVCVCACMYSCAACVCVRVYVRVCL